MNKNIQEQLKTINWRNNIGNNEIDDSLISKVEFVKSSKEFVKKVTSIRWENCIIEFSNELEDIVDNIFPDNIEKWNEKSKEFRENDGA